jgi:predicted nucleic acid-binding protein
MKFLLDTNVFREIGKARPDANVAAWLAGVDDADLAVSVITIREVTKEVARLRVRKPEAARQIETRVTAIFDAFDERILPITKEIAEIWGQLLAVSEKHIDDVALAATARVYRLAVVTRNQRDFTGRGVTTLNPFGAAGHRP